MLAIHVEGHLDHRILLEVLCLVIRNLDCAFLFRSALFLRALDAEARNILLEVLRLGSLKVRFHCVSSAESGALAFDGLQILVSTCLFKIC